MLNRAGCGVARMKVRQLFDAGFGRSREREAKRLFRRRDRNKRIGAEAKTRPEAGDHISHWRRRRSVCDNDVGRSEASKGKGRRNDAT